jgi:hypothetical protein
MQSDHAQCGRTRRRCLRSAATQPHAHGEDGAHFALGPADGVLHDHDNSYQTFKCRRTGQMDRSPQQYAND